jgi:uncharacterized protein involved in tolerance to divalent cations
MKRIIILIALALVLAACSPRAEDITNIETDGESEVVVKVIDPDSAVIVRNIDEYPNYSIICINGDALVSRSSKYADWAPLHLMAGTHSLCGG